MYGTLDDLKLYLGIVADTDDALLERLLRAATAQIDGYTRRRFIAAEETHELTGDCLDNGNTVLYLDNDLFQLDAVSHGDGLEEIDIAAIRRCPNRPPYYALVLRSGAFVAPVYVTGRWGYSATPPDDIVQAAIRLAAYYYRQRDAQVFDVTAIPGQGVITIPRGLPADVRAILDNYQRRI